MPERPAWLPDMVSTNGQWDEVVARLYAVFCQSVGCGQCLCESCEVKWDARKLPGEEYEEGFWHLITKTDRRTGERLPHTQRARRLPWCAPTIENSNDGVVMKWDYVEASSRVRTYLWLKEHDYVVVLERRALRAPRDASALDARAKVIAFLITAFYLDGDYSRRRMQAKYNARVR